MSNRHFYIKWVLLLIKSGSLSVFLRLFAVMKTPYYLNYYPEINSLQEESQIVQPPFRPKELKTQAIQKAPRIICVGFSIYSKEWFLSQQTQRLVLLLLKSRRQTKLPHRSIGLLRKQPKERLPWSTLPTKKHYVFAVAPVNFFSRWILK